jgi:hypothetical protein
VEGEAFRVVVLLHVAADWVGDGTLNVQEW